MRIAQIAPIACRVPPKKYGGTERVVHALTEGLVKKGHNVTLFASGDSVTTAKHISVIPKALIGTKRGNIYGLNLHTLHHIGVAYSMQEDFDIIHDHHGLLSLPTANLSKIPVIMPIHGPFTPGNIPLYKEFTNPYLVTLSNAQLPTSLKHSKNYLGTVHNGLDMTDYPFSPTHKSYLLFVGRISEEKGVHKAIKVAKRLKLPLIIAAKLDLSEDKVYYKKHVEPHLSKDIRWIGQVDQTRRNNLMKNAMAFLHPVKFKEPFGLTLIEAMACGCPVIAFNKGSIPELIKHGETGFIATNTDDMTKYVTRIDTIDRKRTRDHALTEFSAEKMVTEYEKLYRKVLQTGKAKASYPTISSTSPPQVKL